MDPSSREPEGREAKPRGYTLSIYDSRTGQYTVTSLDEPPRVVVQLDDGTRLPVEEYLANRDLYTPPLPDPRVASDEDEGAGESKSR
jgi:hypothetical protein